MIYYRVPPHFDNARVIRRDKHGILRYTDIFLAGNSLYTNREIQKMKAAYFETYRAGRFLTREEIFQPVYVSKNDIHWFFGFRFPNNKILEENGW